MMIEQAAFARFQIRRSLRGGGWYVVDTNPRPFGAAGDGIVDRPDRPEGEYLYKTWEAVARRCKALNDAEGGHTA